MMFRWAYPKNWPELAQACKDRAGWLCEHCGIAHGVDRVNRRTGVVTTVRLAAAHLDHDIWNPRPRLRCLCASCHASYDRSHNERARWLAIERKRHQWLLKCKRARYARPAVC